jgi:hypothetical protein
VGKGQKWEDNFFFLLVGKGQNDYNYEVVPANDDDKPTTSLKF